MQLEAFEVDVDEAVLADLAWRLARTRLADEPAGAGWDYGTSATYLAELVAYWHDEFDWGARQAQLNALPQSMATVDGTRVHFAHLEGRGPAPLPLLLVHGWPSGYLEMTKLAPLLADPGAHGADPADAFSVVVPSLPGFGFSGPTPTRGFGYHAAAGVLHRLLAGGLGYSRYGVHGTGLGQYVNGWLAFGHPEAVVGLHTHDPALMPTPSFEPPHPPPSEAELAFGEA